MDSLRSSWHDDVYFGIHYDLHANDKDTSLGAELTHDHLRATMEKVRPDWIQCDCKGHPGYTSWPTTVGATSPGVVRDSLRIHADVCRDLGIKLGMHYSGVIDVHAMETHPEWSQIKPDGSPYPNHGACRLSPYLDELMIPQLLELIDNYDVDGFWVDGENWAVNPCYCARCKTEFTRRTGLTAPETDSRDEPNSDAWLAFHRDLFTEHVTRYADAVHARKPDCAVCSNWMYTLRQPEPVAAPIDYISGDYNANWGLYRAMLEARFIASRGVSWDLMCWGFTKDYTSRPYASIWKTAEHLKQEVSAVVAQGGAVMVYAKPQRTGYLPGWHHGIMAEVADFCRERKPWSFRSETVPQAAVLHLADHYYAHNAPSFNYGTAVEPVEGALHALTETHRSVDVLNEETALARLSDYPLVVVPEQTRLSAALLSALEAHARAGNAVLLSGTHLPAEAGGLLGVADGGEDIPGVELDRRCGMNLPIDGMAASALGPWRRVRLEGAEPHTPAALNTDPAKDTTDIPAITIRRIGKGAILGAYGPLFRSYCQNHEPLLRRFIGRLVAGLDLPWRVEVDAPAALEMVLRVKDDALVIHLINHGVGEMTYPERTIVETVPPIRDVSLRIRCESRPESIRLQPAGIEPKWSWADGVAAVEIDRIGIHDLLVVK